MAQAEHQQVLEARAKRRQLEQQAKREDLEAQTALEETRRQASVARHEAIMASNAQREEELRRQDAAVRRRQEAQWLQVTYPVALARSLMAWRRNLTAASAKELEAAVVALADTGRGDRFTPVPALFEADNRFSSVCCYTCLPGNGSKQTPVRCSRDFEWILFGQGLAIESPNRDAAVVLVKFIDSICPRASLLFRRRYTMNHLLETSECLASKAFVHAIILLSKWLGKDLFPKGIYGWPPQPPASLGPGAPQASA